MRIEVLVLSASPYLAYAKADMFTNHIASIQGNMLNMPPYKYLKPIKK
jgi:hypothetical protein